VVIAAAVVVVAATPVVVGVRALGVDRPHPPARTAGTRATRPVSVASRLRCTIAIIAGPGRLMHDGKALTRGWRSRPACGAPWRRADILAPVPMLRPMLAAGSGSSTTAWAVGSSGR
jgi:hypothetical protein